MKKYLTLLIIASCLLTRVSFGQFTAHSFLMGNSANAIDVATDPLNNVFAAGKFDFLNNNYGHLVKYTPSGVVSWTAKGTDPNMFQGWNVCTDDSGNVFVAGGISQNPAQLVGGPVWPTEDFFLSKYSSSGTLLWAKAFESQYNSNITGIACDSNGDVIVIGNSNNSTLSFGNNITIDNSTGYILKVTSAGVIDWGKEIQYPFGHVLDIALDNLDNINIVGSFRNSVSIGTMQVSGSPEIEMFVAQLSSIGNPQWIKISAGTPNHFAGATSICTNSSNNIFVCGFYRDGSINIDTVTLPLVGNDKGFVIGFSSFGDVEWATQLGGANNPGNLNPQGIATDNAGNILVGGEFYNSVALGSSTFSTGIADNSLFLCSLRPPGIVDWAIQGGNPNEFDGIYDLVIGPTDECYLVGTNPSGQGLFSFGGLTLMNPEPFLLKITIGRNFNQIKGRVYYDTNSNAIHDLNEQGAPEVLLQLNSSFLGSGGVGLYSALVDSGNHLISIPSPPTYYNLVPNSHYVIFPTFGISDTTRHFALQPIPGMQDLQLTLTHPTVPRPGFAYPLYVTYRNIGTTPQTGSVELQLDSLLLFQNSSPAQSTISGNTLTWGFTNLQPTQSATIVVNTQVPATAILGTTIHQLAFVSPLTGDLTPADNTDADSAIVVGSYDPNDKQVSHTSLTPTQVQNEEWLEYTIRFQNTGTDTAFTVRLADTLSTMLNIPTIEVLASSHPNTWSIKGTGIMEFRFDNILLPDSNTNEAASHGFVKYRVKPKTTLALGDVIENTAYIYFDFNAPIVTNTATTEVKLVASVPTIERNPLHIYPNPNKGEFTLQCSNIWQLQVQAELRNMLGQTIWQQMLSVENGKLVKVVRISGLSKGVYYLQVKTDKGSKVQKVVLE